MKKKIHIFPEKAFERRLQKAFTCSIFLEIDGKTTS
jgi:hypothetical protein